MRYGASLRAEAAQVTRFGDVSICGFLSGSQLPGERGAINPQGDRDSLQLVFVLNGDLCMGHRGLQLHMDPSSWGIFGPDHVVLSASEDADVLVMTIAGTMPVAVYEAVQCATSGVGSVLLTCMKSALQVSADLTSQARAELGHALDDLARLAIRERAAPAGRLPRRSLMRERVKAFVRHHLHDSNLSIDDIAQTFHCTKRYLHKVFSEDERSLNQYIWDLRLDRCSQDLANPGLHERSITEIAFIWGFRSPPHFSRAFRQRFGASPSAWRLTQAAGQAMSAMGPRASRLGGHLAEVRAP